jgi:hypothetical protein
VLPLAPWLAAAPSAISRRLVMGLLVLSVLVQVPGVLVDFTKVGRTSEIGYPTMDERRWTWEASGLRINTRASLAAVPENVKNLATGNRPTVKPGQADARDFSDQFAFSLDLWWVYLFYLGAVPAPLALALGAVCLSIAGLFGWRLHSTLKRRPSAERR